MLSSSAEVQTHTPRLQADRHRFRFERSTDYVNNSIDASEQRRLVNLVAQLARKERLSCLACEPCPYFKS